MVNLEGIIGDKLSAGQELLRRGLGGFEELYRAPGQLKDKIVENAKSTKVFKELMKKISKVPGGKKELTDMVSEYAHDLVNTPGPWRRFLTQYNISNIYKVLGDKAKETSNLIYSLPSRLYPYLNAIGEKARYLTPLGPAYLARDAFNFLKTKAIAAARTAAGAAGTAGAAKDFFKGLLTKAGGPVLYLTGAYVVYRVVKGLLRRRTARLESERGPIEQAMPRSDLEELVEQLRHQNMMLNQLVLQRQGAPL